MRLEKKAGSRPETAWPAAPPRRRLPGSLLLPLFFIVACATVPVERADKSVDIAPPPLAPLFAFLTSAAPIQVGVVEDPRTGQSVRVIAGRAYHAASGRLCRRFEVMPPQSYEGMAKGLACKDEHGRWTKSKLLINPDDLDAPRLQLP